MMCAVLAAQRGTGASGEPSALADNHGAAWGVEQEVGMGHLGAHARS